MSHPLHGKPVRHKPTGVKGSVIGSNDAGKLTIQWDDGPISNAFAHDADEFEEVTAENDIPDTHMAFARELIVLARAHGMNNLEVRFNHAGERTDWSAPHRDTKTTFVWKEGRHGAQTNIYMTRTEAIRFEEKVKP